MPYLISQHRHERLADRIETRPSKSPSLNHPARSAVSHKWRTIISYRSLKCPSSYPESLLPELLALSWLSLLSDPDPSPDADEPAELPERTELVSDSSHDALEFIDLLSGSSSSGMIRRRKVSVARRGTCDAGVPSLLGTLGRMEVATVESRRKKDISASPS